MYSSYGNTDSHLSVALTNSWIHDSANGVFSWVHGLSSNTNTLIADHNTITGCTRGVYFGSTTSNYLYNTVFANNGTALYAYSGAATLIHEYDGLYGNGANYHNTLAGTGVVTADPLLDWTQEPPAPSYLSPLVGAAGTSTVTTDYWGNARPSPATIGAVEPSALEILDGVDNDLDGYCDEGLLSAGALVITEIQTNPVVVADGDGEWFEVYNATTTDITLCDGWTVSDDVGSHAVTGDVVIPAGGSAVFAASDDTALNNGVAVDYAYGSALSLHNDADVLTLTFDGTVIDSVAYGSTSPWTLSRRRKGKSLSLRSAWTDATSNDDGANWCTSRTSYGFNLAGKIDQGTPGDANDC
jgi:hypothetical protein